MSTCILSPYGTYNTADACNSSEICGMRWRCARHAVNGVYEKDPVTGQDVLPGNPILAHDGTFDTPEEVICYECVVDMGNETAECRATDGVQGTSPDDTCGGACNYGYDCEEGDLVWKQDGPYGSDLTSCDYVCDGGGEKMLVEPGESFPNTSSWDALQCYSCDPAAESPIPTASGGVGVVGASDTCTYTCADGSKVFDASGLTAQNLKCYQCLGGQGSVPQAVDGTGGYVDVGDACTYACDGQGNKVYNAGGANDYDNFGCYECTGGHDYTPVQEGSTVSKTTGGFDNDGGKCWYWCNDESSPEAIVGPTRDGLEDPSQVSQQTLGDVACWTCEGDPGPGSGCAQVTQGVGQFSSAETCDTDSGAQCGWGYGCENDSCAITSSATRGRSEEECKFDSTDKCGWGYGCFNKFACVDGISCAPVPEEECTVNGGKFVCHDSADECVANSACAIVAVECPDNPFQGKWRLVNGDTGEKVYDGDDFDISPTGNINPDGDRVFQSSQLSGNAATSYIIFGDFIDGETGNRVISVMVTAYPYSADYESYEVGATQRYRYFATSGGEVARGPGRSSHYALATIPPDSPDFYGCAEIDEIDLTALCERRTTPGSCISPGLGYRLVLERVI